mmetsp:Transcript_55837/g.134708  ORF Transcript_55837/g.134708 Transcript_55837/m.134708 type:complete len:81 (-) Transcript_55837:6-248(-)
MALVGRQLLAPSASLMAQMQSSVQDVPSPQLLLLDVALQWDLQMTALFWWKPQPHATVHWPTLLQPLHRQTPERRGFRPK